MTFALVTDSASSLSHTAAAELGLTVLPLSYFIDEVEYPGFIKDKPIDLKFFYNSMREGKPVRTSLPTPSETRKTLIELLEQGKDILYLGFSCGLSGTFDSVNGICEMLKSDYPERKILCVETVAASFGEGLLVRHAAAKKLAGASMEEIAEWVRSMSMKVAHWITVDDLSFVLGGGRMGKHAARAANFLNLKPILRIDEQGAIDVPAKARGRKKSLKLMVDKVKSTYDPNLTREVIIAHGDCVEDAEYLQKMINSEVSEKCECEIEYLDPVIGTHGGPGSMAIFFFGTGRK